MYLFLGGVILLGLILSLFWLKDYLKSPLLMRIAYAGLTARLAVLGAAFSLLGLLLVITRVIDNWSQ